MSFNSQRASVLTSPGKDEHVPIIEYSILDLYPKKDNLGFVACCGTDPSLRSIANTPLHSERSGTLARLEPVFRAGRLSLGLTHAASSIKVRTVQPESWDWGSLSGC
jgi:hypothetical protein